MDRLCIKDFKSLAKLCGIDYQTFMFRLKDPGTLRVFELREIHKVLQFTPEDLILIVSNNN